MAHLQRYVGVEEGGGEWRGGCPLVMGWIALCIETASFPGPH